MKKKAIILSILVIVLVFQLFSDINSEVNYIEGNKFYTVFPVLNSPISVDKETLLVDNKLENLGYVNDSYVMTNTSSEKVSVPIILPVLKNDNEHKDIDILVNDEQIDYEIKWLLDSEKYSVSNNNNKEINIEELLNDYNYKENYKFKNVDPNEKVWVYEILLEDKKNIIKVENNEEPLKLIYLPVDIGKYKVNYSSNLVEFSMNKGIQDKFQIVLFDTQLEDIIIDCNVAYTKKEMRLKQYIRQVINRYYNKEQSKPENVDINTEIVSHILYYIDKNMELDQNKFIPLDNILNNYIDLVYYTIDFEPNEVKKMELSYKIKSTYNKIKTIEPVHTFKYDLSTLNYWESFNSFDMEVKLGENYKYLVESSIPFKDNGNIFTISLNTIPKSQISYSIYSEDIKLDNNSELTVKKKIKVLIYAFCMILLIFIVSKITTRKSKEIIAEEENKNYGSS